MTVTGTIAAALALSALAVAPAAADPGTDGFWYFDLPHIQDAHDAGITGEGVTIAVIDGQINLQVPTLQDADIEVQPSLCWEDDGTPIPPTSTDILANHGTNVVSLIVGTGAGYSGQTGVKGVAPGAKVLYYSIGRDLEDQSHECNSDSGEPKGKDGGETAIGESIFEAVDAGVDIISISQGGSYDPYTMLAISHALHDGIVVIAGVPNEGLLDDEFSFGGGFPAAYNGVVGVQSGDTNGQSQGGHVDIATDVIGPGVNLVWQGASSWEEQRYATGTSLATPIVAGFLALVADKYPDATGNQLIQTLVRNTGLEDHELYFDPTGATGYGSASATHMLRNDPSQYEDVNPLILDAETAVPTREQIENPAALDEHGQSESPTDDENELPTGVAEPDLWPILAAIGGGLLVLGIVATLIVVLLARRARTNHNTPPA